MKEEGVKREVLKPLKRKHIDIEVLIVDGLNRVGVFNITKGVLQECRMVVSKEGQKIFYYKDIPLFSVMPVKMRYRNGRYIAIQEYERYAIEKPLFKK